MAGGVEWLIFFDTESTGLPKAGNIPRITELCLLAVSVRAIKDNDQQFQKDPCLPRDRRLPRVLHKLTLCLDPAQPLSSFISDLTGLHDEELGEVRGLSADTVALLSGFVKQLKGAACLVAHNGNRFDFPLLAAEMSRVGAVPLPPGLMVADTLPAFRAWHAQNICAEAESSRTPDQNTHCDIPPRKLQNTTSSMSSAPNSDSISKTAPSSTSKSKTAPSFDSKLKTVQSSDSKSTPANKVSQQPNASSGSVKPSFKLSELHVRLLGHPFSGAHGAEADTMALLRCTLAAGPRFLELLIDSSSRFSEVAPMH